MHRRWIAAVTCLLLASLASCGRGSDDGAVTTTPGSPPTSAGLCGDGVCDPLEEARPDLCPQDCSSSATIDAAGGTTTAPIGDAATYEPPINVVVVVHSDPEMDSGARTFEATPLDYRMTTAGLSLLAAEADRHGAYLSALFNGWYPTEALQAGDLSSFEALSAAGHEIGTHAHRLTYDPAADTWNDQALVLSTYGRPRYDEAVARQCWEDAAAAVTAVLDALGAAGGNRVMATRYFTFSTQAALMDEFGFTVAAGGVTEFSQVQLGHGVWNPWRPSGNDEPGHELEEDLGTAFIAIDHLSQIGTQDPDYGGVDLSVAQVQRHFLLLYTEWLHRVRTGAPDKVWTFGFVYHANLGDRHLESLAAFLDWLDANFIGRTTPEGHAIARYATLSQVADEFYTWEAAHPGTSSFHYAPGDPYPYSFPVLATALTSAAYQETLDLGPGVTCFRFEADGRSLYLLWSDDGERTVDLGTGGQVTVTDMTGAAATVDAAALPLTEEPLLAQPVG